ncbi:MAG: mechanosensitive ion channel family protein [Acidimicrobiales bacterium]
MARPLWRDLREARQQRSLAPISTMTGVPLPPKPRFGLAAASTLIALAALVVVHVNHGSVYSHSFDERVWAWTMSGVFLIFGSIAVRRVATQFGRLVHVGGGPTAGAALRLILTLGGLLIVIIVTIGLLGVNPTQLLAAAGITGVIFGLAAQQSLGNVFAGIVLMVARPFSVGQRIRVRYGTFGGVIDGEVRGMGLTYVDLMTDEGPVKMPNLGMLSAAVGPAPAPERPENEPTLYVDRAIPRRPPRVTSPQGNRRQHPEYTVRRPRDIIWRARRRHEKASGPPSQASPRDSPPAHDSTESNGIPEGPSGPETD